jgi:hypothetical protein
MARARRWNDEKFQHNSVSKRLVRKRGGGRVPIYTSRGKVKALG